MLSSTLSSTSKLHAYRHLYRALLHAVQYSSPARYVARNQLRYAFRHGDPTQFDQHKISRTLEFLNIAAQERGLEHRIVKNLLHTAYWRAQNLKRPVQSPENQPPLTKHLRETSSIHYDMTVAMLNNSMGLCLR